MADLGGEGAVSTQQAARVDLAVRSKLLVDSVDAYVLAMPSPVNKKRRQLFAVVVQRQARGGGGHVVRDAGGGAEVAARDPVPLRRRLSPRGRGAGRRRHKPSHRAPRGGAPVRPLRLGATRSAWSAAKIARDRERDPATAASALGNTILVRRSAIVIARGPRPRGLPVGRHPCTAWPAPSVVSRGRLREHDRSLSAKAS